MKRSFATWSIGMDEDATVARYRPQTRAAQIAETIRLARYSAVTPLLVAITLVSFFWYTPHRTYMLMLLALVAMPTIAAVVLAETAGRRISTSRGVEIGHRAASLFALVLGCAWGTMPAILFTDADAPQRLIVVGTTVGVLADVYVFGPILPVCLLFSMPITIGGFIGILSTGEPIGYFLSILLAIYAVFIILSCRLLSSLSTQRIVDRVRVSEQSDTINLLLRDFQENTSDWLWETDAEGKLRHASERVAQAAGLSVADLKDAPLGTLFRNRCRPHPFTDSVIAVFELIEARKPFHDSIVEIAASGPSIWWRLSGKPINDAAGRFVGYRGVGSEITAARNAEARVAFMANHDALTGLKNRGHFLSRAALECKRIAHEGACLALFYLDLDGFKSINDRLGHATGDRLLKEVASRLSALLGDESVISRLGGDEFAILMRCPDMKTAEGQAQRMVDAIGVPYHLDEAYLNIGVSIGIASAPGDSTDPEALLTKADLALYNAKAQGKGRYEIFAPAFEESLSKRLELENDLRLAIARREFLLHYQPVVDLASGRVVCFEALIRWQNEKRGFVRPDAFIPAAESIGLITAIGRWCLIKACQDAIHWPDGIHVAVNISAHHFRNADFVQDTLVALELSGLESARLEIEITESALLDNCQEAIDNLRALRSRGIRIALDDFGTGFSSLSYLINFPVDKLKIDQSFVRHIVDQKRNRAIIDAIIALANELSIEVIAEGVETIEQAMTLKGRGCRTIQGYLFSTPQPNSDLGRVMQNVASIAEALDSVRPLRPFTAFPLTPDDPEEDNVAFG